MVMEDLKDSIIDALKASQLDLRAENRCLQAKLDEVAALRWRIYVIEGYIAAGGYRGWMYNSSPFLIPYVLDRILEA